MCAAGKETLRVNQETQDGIAGEGRAFGCREGGRVMSQLVGSLRPVNSVEAAMAPSTGRGRWLAVGVVSGVVLSELLVPGVAFGRLGWALSGVSYSTNLVAAVDGEDVVRPEEHAVSFTLSYKGQT